VKEGVELQAIGVFMVAVDDTLSSMPPPPLNRLSNTAFTPILGCSLVWKPGLSSF